MNKKNLIAQELFLKYGGSHFQMERAGEYEKYLAFGISKKQESDWGKARRTELLKKLIQDPLAGKVFHELVGLIEACKDFQGFRLFLDQVRKSIGDLDTFTQLRFAEEVFNLCSSFQSLNLHEPILLSKSRHLTIELVKAAQEGKFSIAPYYRGIPYLQDALTEERISGRIEILREKLGI